MGDCFPAGPHIRIAAAFWEFPVAFPTPCLAILSSRSFGKWASPDVNVSVSRSQTNLACNDLGERNCCGGFARDALIGDEATLARHGPSLDSRRRTLLEVDNKV